MGEYKMEAGLTRHGRPVWKKSGQSTRYFFYCGAGFWRMGLDYKKDSESDYKSLESGLTSIPETGWMVHDHDGWSSHPKMTGGGE